jgi:hypothetical protein
VHILRPFPEFVRRTKELERDKFHHYRKFVRRSMRPLPDEDDMPEPKPTKRVVREVLRNEPSPLATVTAPAPEQALENAVSAVTVDPAPAKAAHAAKVVSDDALAYGQQAWAALAEAQAATVRGLEAAVEEMNAFTRSEMAAAADGATALIGARTFAEAMEVNLGYARRTFDALIGSSAKLSEIGAKTASDASRPILSRLGDGWKMPQTG